MIIKARFDPDSFAAVDLTTKQLKRIIFAAHAELDANLRLRNPFDSGFSASSWWAMADGQPAANPQAPSKGNPGGGRGAADPSVLLASIGATLTLANDANYIQKLNEGYSPQAPAGWVNAVANDYQDYIDAALLKEKGK